MKKTWTKPKLVALFRGTPEESVLGWCKVDVSDPTGATTDYAPCDRQPDCSGFCELETNT